MYFPIFCTFHCMGAMEGLQELMITDITQGL
jgi:hypothetical protein